MSEKEVLVPEVIEKNITEMATDSSMEEALAVIENRGRLWDKVMETAIKSTKSRHWVDFGGKPYLEAAGAEGVARRFNLNIYDQAMDGPTYHEDARGRYYMFICTGKCGFPGHREYIEAVGSCSSRDKFFGTTRDGLKEIEDVDMRNVRQKAYTNFVANAVTRFLGMRDLSWEELGKYGITKQGKTQVTFKTKTSSAPAGGSPQAPQSTENGRAFSPAKDTSTVKPTSTPQNGSSKKEGNPMWVWDGSDGSRWISARLGTHFADSFLKGCGMKSGKKPEIFSARYSDSLLEVLNAQLAKGNEPEESVDDIFPPEVGSNG